MKESGRSKRVFRRLALPLGILLLCLLTWYLYHRAQMLEELRPALWEAARVGEAKRVGELLDLGVDPNARPGPPPNSSFWDRLRRMLRLNAAPSSGQGQTALMAACAHNDLPCARLLLDHGADPNLRDDEENSSALLEALSQGDHSGGSDRKQSVAALANELLDHGADPGAADTLHRTPLFFAAFAPDDSACIDALLKHGAKLNSVVNESGDTLLNFACGYGKTDIALDLVRRGADVNVTDNAGNTPFIGACLQGDDDVVNALISACANVRAVNASGETGLTALLRYSAAHRGFSPNVGYLRFVRLLVYKGVPVADADGQSRAILAARKCAPTDTYIRIVALLERAARNEKVRP